MVDCAMFHRRQTATTGGESSAIVTFESEVAAYTLLGLDGAVNPHVCAPGLPLRARSAWRLQEMVVVLHVYKLH